MYGVLYFFVLGAHLIFSLLMIKIAVAMAKAGGKPGWYYGLPTGLLMFSLLYWDLIPTHVVHRYYCISEGGFTVYKTLDEWKQENPDIADNLIPNSESQFIEKNNYIEFILNQRFSWERYTTKYNFGVRKIDNRIVDRLTGELLAQFIDYDTDISDLAIGARSLRDYKVWLKQGSCEFSGNKKNKTAFSQYKYVNSISKCNS